MAPQYDQVLPDGTTLHVIDAATAGQYLHRLLYGFMAKQADELIIGVPERAQLAVIPPGTWVRYLELHEQREPDVALLARQRLAAAARTWRSVEEFTQLLQPGDGRTGGDRTTPQFNDLKIEAVDVQIAADQLEHVVAALDRGLIDVLFLGDAGTAEGVVIPASDYLHYLELEEDGTGDERIAQIVRERIANTPLENTISDEELMAAIRDRDHDS